LVGGLFADAAGDSALRDTSLLVAGALAHRAGEPLADGRTPLQALLAMEGEATARGGLSTWLLAVANSGAPEVLPTALRLLDHADRDVRAAACVALRGPAEATALRALLERGLADQDPIVRTETVLSLSRRPEPAAREALERVASEDQDESVRGRARRLLERGE
jgi:HEAT repeat protein